MTGITQTQVSGFPGGSDGKDSACNVERPGSIPGLGRSPVGGHGNPLQYSCLENSMDRGAWWTTLQSSSITQLYLTLCDPMDCSSSGLPVHHWSLFKLMSIELVRPSNHLIFCHPLLLLPSIFSSIRVFSNEVTSHEVAKELEFQLQHHSLQRNPRADLLQNGLV